MYQIKRKSLKERLERGGYQTGEINADSAGISFAFEKRDKEATIQRERERERERSAELQSGYTRRAINWREA
jgi:hypothetical protein